MAAVAAPALALALAGGAAASAASRAAAPSWRQLESVSVKGWPSTELTGVAAPARKDAWVLGDSYNGNTASGPSTLRHWNGTKWKRALLPAPQATVLAAEPGAAVLTAHGRDVWVVGPSHWVRYDGHTWSDGTTPGDGSLTVKAAAALRPHDVWVFGAQPAGAYAGRFDGTRWTRTPLPAAGPGYTVSSVSAVTPRDIWAAIDYAGQGSGPAEIVHWNGDRWTAVALPASFSADRFTPFTVYARSASDVWAGGIVPSGKTGSASGLAHWDGRRWTTVKLGSDTAPQPADIAADGAGGMWILPGSDTAPWKLWHYTRGRLVTITPAGGPELGQLAHVPGTRSVWAVGSSSKVSDTPGVIYLYGPVPR